MLSAGCLIFNFWFSKRTQDPFLSLAPVDSVLYVSARDSVWPEVETKISDLPFVRFFEQAGKMEIFSGVDLKNDILNRVKRAAWLLVPDEDSQLRQVFLFEFKEPPSVPTEFGPDTIFGQNYLVVAETEAVLDKIRQVKSGFYFSLADRRGRERNKSVFSLYLNAANLKSYLKNRSGAGNNFFVQWLDRDLFLSLKKKGDNWRLSLPGQNSGRIKVQPPLIDFLPADFSYYFSGISLAHIFSRLDRVEPGILGLVKQTQTAFQAIYRKDLNVFVSLAINDPAAAVIFAKNKDYQPGFGLVLAAPAPTSETIDELEDLVRIFLAQKLPAEKKHWLLDKSVITELSAEPENWQWQEEMTGDSQKIRFISEPALAFELAYSVRDNKIFLANSKKLLAGYFAGARLAVNDLLARCGGQEGKGRFLIINPFSQPGMFLPYRPEGFFIIKEGKKELSGCISDL